MLPTFKRQYDAHLSPLSRAIALLTGRRALPTHAAP